MYLTPTELLLGLSLSLSEVEQQRNGWVFGWKKVIMLIVMENMEACSIPKPSQNNSEDISLVLYSSSNPQY